MDILANEKLQELEGKALIVEDEMDKLEKALDSESNPKKAAELQEKLEILSTQLEELTEEISEIQESMSS